MGLPQSKVCCLLSRSTTPTTHTGTRQHRPGQRRADFRSNLGRMPSPLRVSSCDRYRDQTSIHGTNSNPPYANTSVAKIVAVMI